MTIKFECEHCRKTVEAPEAAGGKRGKCPYCGQSNYIPAPLGEDDVLPLAPIDEQEDRRSARERHSLIEQERDMLVEMDRHPETPLEQREKLTSKDLQHFVVNYCIDAANGNLERAESYVPQLRKFGQTGLQAVEDFISGNALEPAMDFIPRRVLQGFLTKLRDRLK